MDAGRVLDDLRELARRTGGLHERIHIPLLHPVVHSDSAEAHWR